MSESANIFKIKSNAIMKTIFLNVNELVILKLMKNNKKIKSIVNIQKSNYEDYFQIEIEITPEKNKLGKFVNIPENWRNLFHIYLNNNDKQTNISEIHNTNEINSIKIKIDISNNNSLSGLFRNIRCIKEIIIKKLNRKNINDMSYMFAGCSSLKKLLLNNLNTINVTNMSHMFSGCTSLTE